MEIVGEKINGTRKRVARAIAERDEAFISELAISQVNAGADYVDLNAGTRPEEEPEDLLWLVKTVQEHTDTPISLDSANPKALSAALPRVKHRAMVNSINGEEERLNAIIPLAAEYGCKLIILAMDSKQIPKTAEDRAEIINAVVKRTDAAGIERSLLYVDSLAMTLSTNTASGKIFCDTVSILKEKYPHMHFTAGLSNISFGLPKRSYINRAFLTLAVEAGLDSAILDPTDRDLMAAAYASELVLGRDRYCMNYTKAYKAGIL